MKPWKKIHTSNLLYRKEVLKTSWKLRIVLLVLLILFLLGDGSILATPDERKPGM